MDGRAPHASTAMAEVRTPAKNVTKSEAQSIPTITIARAEHPRSNQRSFSRNASLSASQITLVESPPGLISEDDSRSESSADEDFEPASFTLEKLRDKVDKNECKFNRQLARLLKIQEGQSKWSGTGEIYDVDYDTIVPEVKNELKFKPGRKELGKGGFGIVQKVKCLKIAMARKSIVAQSSKHLAQIKAETDTTKKVAEGQHRHLIQLVGYYRTTDDHSGITTYLILTFPVADCDLDSFLNDCEAVRKANFVYDRPETQHILQASAPVDMPQQGAFREQLLSAIQSFVSRIMGCMADAVMWMHSEAIAIAHQDLKPANILIRHGRLYVTDFGISRDRTGSETAQTEFVMGRSQIFSSPQIEYQEKFVPYKADVYSLGCIFLHLLSVIYGTATIDEVNKVLQSSWGDRDEKVHDHILGLASVSTQNFKQASRYSYSAPPQELVDLVQDMLMIDEDMRPNSAEVNRELRNMGGDTHRYHSQCCAQVETKPAPEYKVTPEVTGMQVNLNPGDELDRHVWGRDTGPAKLTTRNPYASSASQREDEQSMFGLSRSRKEHEGRRDKPSDRLVSAISKRIAEEMKQAQRQRTQPLENEELSSAEPSLSQLPPNVSSPGRKYASDTIMSDPIVASEYSDEDTDSKEENDLEEGDDENAQKRDASHLKTTRVTSTLTLQALKTAATM